MNSRTIVGTIASGVLVLTLSACGGSAAASASTAASTTEPSIAASEAAPSVTESSAAAASPTESGLVLPSFTLPSGAKDLEALLPAKLCGETAIKLSMSGAQFTATADPNLKAILAALGKQASDVSFAVAGGATSGCTAGIFRIAGIDQGRLQDTFVAQQRTTGAAITQGTVGGKNVFISDTNGTKEYVYFKGDAAIFVQAKDAASVASILQQLP
jgi:hypothetical protein